MQRKNKPSITDIHKDTSSELRFLAPKKKLKKKTKTSFWVVGFFLLIAVVVTGRLTILQYGALKSSEKITNQLLEAKTALREFDPEMAKLAFENIDTEVKEVTGNVQELRIDKIIGFFTEFKHVPSILSSLLGLSSSAVNITDDIVYLKNNSLELMMSSGGKELIVRLEELSRKIELLVENVNKLEEYSQDFDIVSGQDLFALKADLVRNAEALDSLIGFLKNNRRHIVVLFTNESEMRPGGGFIGSFAHVQIDNGSVSNITTTDVYDPDGQIDIKVVPPEPMQSITPDWETRDSNWFFNFPTSAAKVIYFLNNSKIYSEQNITFDGVISMNTKVFTDILRAVGPVELAEYDLTITHENFLEEIQEEVESGDDNRLRGEPKRILKVLTPIVLERINSLSEESKVQLMKSFQHHIQKKNLMAFTKNKSLEFYLRTVGLAGDVYLPKRNIISEYLAVVNANIAGHKTDAYIKQSIHLSSRVNISGEIRNELSITRTHSGDDRDEWWYNALNKNYLQVYTTLGSVVTKVTGRSPWPRTPNRGYVGYIVDKELGEIESTTSYLREYGVDRSIAFDKTVYSAWFNTPAGEAKTFRIEYINPQKLPISSKLPYEFVFEKQSGADTELIFEITAPVGYKWKESDNSLFSYTSSDPDSRVIIRLTLLPLSQ
ncbi:MAG: hypothetical protein COU06_01790 [Candidatus Harrisonbacteria bacterium CG10_big_fil_rev_8_21_14_0_10_38_8]|uniref:DUF4012 domain-containing protein n=1 Tax=Candidatus Harrisonbacteria bacterium CG10_big_fil_rev_8_21_14_0_10_38_8 TaxID=1974582 RepID=A0A2M6WK29_9BACT|nr:MAG: hypothetical protein COU06_01790 [Candidatus Harrisonbacteria bacterium CG10_big_fil_rev_8_21_14_0_10_38_8]